MSVFTLDINNQNFTPIKENKLNYGEVNTPYTLINEMLDLIEMDNPTVYNNPKLKWLDPACGCGYYIYALYNRLFNGLEPVISSPIERNKHILNKMIFICEINASNIEILKRQLGKEAINITHGDFLNDFKGNGFDYIIGNPPYNCNGLKKVPTLKTGNKKNDGYTIWDKFVKHSTALLKTNRGKLSFIIPSIWMKPDIALNYNFFFNLNILYIKTFNNTQTNSIFKGQAQTPTCYFLLENSVNNACSNTFQLYDSLYDKYVEYTVEFLKPIPLDYAAVFKYIDLAHSKLSINSLFNQIVVKTNMPKKGIVLSDPFFIGDREITNDKQYININTCKIVKKTGNNIPTLEGKLSNIGCSYHGKPKIILSHKMYGFPYYDKDGVFGICNRDNYVILIERLTSLYPNLSNRDIELIMDFLNDPFTLILYEATRYRMKYLEKYIFSLLPNIVEIYNRNDIKERYNRNTLFKILEIPDELIEIIEDKISSKKQYSLVEISL